MADHRHKRETNARRFNLTRPRALAVVAPLAVLATVSTVGLGVLASDPVVDNVVAGSTPSTVLVDRAEPPVTRSTSRLAPVESTVKAPNAMSKSAIRTAVKKADTRLWTTDELNVWDDPGSKAAKLGEIEAGEKVLVTGREMWGRIEIVLDGKSRWVTAGYLSEDEPPTLGGECTNGTSVPSGVSSSIAAIHSAVCANFPEISVYGTLRGGGGDHPLGKAMDIMIPSPAGQQVADFLRENYAALGISYVIHAQRIWSVQRSGEGWRYMENRGSSTANHYDHVHVSVY